MTIDDTVNTIITEARTFAQDTFEAAVALTTDAVNEANASFTITPPIYRDSLGSFDEPNTTGDPGVFTGQFFRPTSNPDRPVFQPIYVPELPDLESAPAVLDTSDLFNVPRPAFNVPEFDENAPDINTAFVLPDSPTVTFPDAPNQSEITIPDAPEITLPRFNQVFDDPGPGDLEDLSSAYEASFEKMVPQFRTAIENQMETFIDRFSPNYHVAMAKLEEKIQSGIDGGTAMSDSVEQAIFDRARYRAEEEFSASIRAMERDISTRGFPIPPGVLNELTLQIRMKMSKDVVAAATDVAIERARLEQQHAQFIMQVSANLRQMIVNGMLQYANTLLEVNAQALQYSRELNEIALTAYNASVERYRIKLEVYRIQAQVYEVELKSALADMQAYEMEIEAAKLRKDIEQQDLEAYVQKIQAQRTKIDLYLAQLQGVTTQANTERLRIELYGEKVRAHSLLVQAKEAEFGAYRAAIQGDAEKVQAYAAEVNAYHARVRGFEAIANVENTKAQIALESNRNISAIYEADIRKYLADVQVETAAFEGDIREYTTRIDKYKADLAATIDILRSKIDFNRLELDADRTKYDGDLRVVLERAEIKKSLIDLRARTAVSAADTLNTMAAAALQSQNTMVQLVATESV